MKIDTIKSPNDLLGRSYEELDDLCSQIRARIIEVVNRHGGHLGPNLGVVELTVALHRVFRSPHDVILWDTGHQAYVHKMLTGRLGDFDTLRQAGGLSGYPSQAESGHDWIENSHASTALSYAHGIATAFAINDSRRRVVAVVGDGAMTGGMAYEGLNNLGHSNSNVVIVFNDNGRSYAPTVSKLSESLIRILSNPAYMQYKARIEQITERMPWAGEMVKRSMKMSRAAIRELWEPSVFFEDLGVHYIGPFDGHDIASLEEALTNASGFDGPVLVHVLTMKGKGYEPAEADNIKHMHDTGSMSPSSYTAMFSDTLVELAEQHPELIAITAAMPDSTGLLPFKEHFSDRFIDVGIAEQHAVTAATGMALAGLRPVIAVYSTFLSRAFDQVNLDCGLHKAPVIFCLDRAGITGDDGPSHHGIFDMVLLTKIPGMTVLAPSSLQELKQMMHDAMAIKTGPVAIRWPKTAARNVAEDQVGAGLRARQVREGDDTVCLIGVGKMLEACEQAASILSVEGINATVWDPRVVRPLCDEMLKDAYRHKLVVTVEDGLCEGGAGSGFRAALDSVGVAGEQDRPRVVLLGVPLKYIPHGKADDILAQLGLDGAGIAATVRLKLD
ncbi:MAG: 1-deoxy-D-xylulose-5-phosphate synthase [Acidimicrobiaceae bacterium]|nr:1-deoxy-D-xylulose-5-phosphate synthase [Acidimicrobiaceae bacterium]